MAILYGRAGRLTAQNGGFRPGQCSAPAPGSYTNASDYSERTCQSCGAVAADCSSVDWHSGPLSRNTTTNQWKREQDIHTVHLVFSTHFDVGCAWNVHTVMDLFFHRYIPQILAIQEGLRGMGYTERLPFLMQVEQVSAFRALNLAVELLR